MADDRMRNDDLDRNMGGQHKQEDYGKQQSPGRNKQDDDLRTGQRAGQGQQHQPGYQKDEFGDDFGTGSDTNKGGQGQGGRNR